MHHVIETIGLWNESASFRHCFFAHDALARRHQQTDARPMPTDVVREHQPVHRTRHVHIGKDDVNADRLMFQNGERLTGMARFDHPEIRLFQSSYHRKADQDLVFDDDNDDNMRRGYRADHGSNTVWSVSGFPTHIPVDRWRP
jgi:hypothetical protein